MAITASMVKELRELTGAGMMDCKKALTETNGDMDAAVEVLKKSGAAKAEKKAARIAAEGIAKVAIDGNTAVVVEVNSETDFVAKNAIFQEFVQAVADKALTVDTEKAGDGEDVVSILDMKADLDDKILKIGEKISIRRFEKVVEENGCVVTYTHGGGRIGVIVDAETAVVNDAVKEALTNVAMQIAALSPKYISTEDVSEEYKAHEKEILFEQIKNDPKMAGKPEKVIEGAVSGRLNKELKEVCLLEQVYVKAEDGKQSVKQYIDTVAKANGTDIKIKKFVRFETGEGLEKKHEDFAAEVAAQMNK